MGNVFSSDRPMSSDAMLEQAIARKQQQRSNRQALIESRKLSENIPDVTAVMEAARIESENTLKREKALESAYYKQGTKNLGRMRFGLRNRLLENGFNYVSDKVLFETIYRAYWVDEPVKECTVEAIEESIDGIMSYLAENCSSSKVAESNLSAYMKSVNEAVKGIVSEATERLVKEAETNALADIEFSLTDDEEDELDKKLVDLGRDEIVDLIKEKIAAVVQDERARGQEKAEMFKEIDNLSNPESSEEPPIDGTPTEGETASAESTMVTWENTVSLTEALQSLPHNSMSYTANERFMFENVIKCDDVNIYEDPTWGEFKMYVSMMCKKAAEWIRSADNTGSKDTYLGAVTVINELIKKLEICDVEVPTEVQNFVDCTVGLITGAIPVDEIIVSRMNTVTAWSDLLVNVKVNLNSVKNYLETKAHMAPVVNTPKQVDTKPSLESMVALKNQRIMNRNIGDTLFEAFMIGSLAKVDKATMESAADLSGDDVEGAALIESLLNYTVLETLDSLGIYKFRASDINNIKRSFVRSVSEGEDPFQSANNSDDVNVSKTGKKSLSTDNNGGTKTVRINTRKMKRNNDADVMSM